MRLPGGDLPRTTRPIGCTPSTTPSRACAVCWGRSASDALDREEAVPATGALADDGSPLATVVRLFLLGEPVAEAWPPTPWGSTQ